MYSSDSPPAEDAAPAAGYREGFDQAQCGRRAECDGGQGVEGTHFAGRQEFSGTLTGHFRDFGEYPWRWYLMTKLTHKPAGYPHEGVWCAAESLVFEDEQA